MAYSKCMIVSSGSSFTLPTDWNPADNTIHCIGAGSSTGSLTQGGTAGSYAAKINAPFAAGATVACQVGVWGGDGTITSVANTWVNAYTYLRASGGYGGRQSTTNVGDVTFTGGTTRSGNSGGGGAAGPHGAGASPSGTSGGAGDAGWAAGGTGGSSPTNGQSKVLWTDNSGGPNNGATAGPGGGGGGSTTSGRVGGSGGFYGGGQGVGPAGGGASRGGVIVLEWNPAADVTAPTITTNAAQSVVENTTLSVALTADETVTWSIVGGADQAQFQISGSTLQWSSNGTRDYEAPADSDASNTYVVTVRATDTSSNTSDLTITVTVTNSTADDPHGSFKVNVGGLWQAKPVKVYLAGQWVTKPLKMFISGQWRTISSVIGPELVVNGTFDTDASGWTGQNAALSVSGGVLTVMQSGNWASPFAYQSIATTPGKTYRVQYDAVDGTAGIATVDVADALGGTALASGSAGTGQSFTFVADASTTYIRLNVNAGGAASGFSATFDNISVREIP